MDTTKEFILMCEKATKLQRLHFNRFNIAGDIVYCKTENRIVVLFEKASDKYSRIESNIWLPRQDQLQKMVMREDNISDGFMYLLWDFARDVFVYNEGTYTIWGDISESYKQFKTMEQLWLAFVMKEKYQKIWNGKEWVK